jgi:hypothetical protein
MCPTSVYSSSFPLLTTLIIWYLATNALAGFRNPASLKDLDITYTFGETVQVLWEVDLEVVSLTVQYWDGSRASVGVLVGQYFVNYLGDIVSIRMLITNSSG